MKEIYNGVSFLVVGKTQDVDEVGSGFKRYVGVGSSSILAVNPTKQEADKIMGYDTKEPEYVVDGENGKEARVTFIVETDPAACNKIDIKNFLSFTLRNAEHVSQSGNVRVIDKYGNSAWVSRDYADSGKALPTNLKIDQQHYRKARHGEADLVAFLKAYLNVPSALEYNNGVYSVKADPSEAVFELENINDYFKGDFSEIKKAIALQPNNKVKLLYGVSTNDEGKQKQKIVTNSNLILRNSISDYKKLGEAVVKARNANLLSNIECEVCPLKEYVVEATDLSKAPANTATSTAADTSAGNPSKLPWEP